MPSRWIPVRSRPRKSALKRGKRPRRRSVRGEEEKALDAMLREYVMRRDQNRCRRCGKEPRKGRGQALETAHILPKGKYPSLRYVTDNVLALCHACHHGFAHKDPLGMTLWLSETLGEEHLKRLQHYRVTPGKVDRAWDRVRLEQLLRDSP